MQVTQGMEYHVECPCCGNIWSFKRTESRPSIPGPICIEEVHDDNIVTETKTNTVLEVRDEFGSLLDWKEDEETKTSSDRSKYKGQRHDYDAFLPYYQKYVNGDKNAVDRYYRDRWDTITWQELWLPKL